MCPVASFEGVTKFRVDTNKIDELRSTYLACSVPGSSMSAMQLLKREGWPSDLTFSQRY
jgi:hypothetical protein